MKSLFLTQLDWLKPDILKVLITESLKAWLDHRAASKGAALAFYTLFSLTPILVLAIAVAGYFFGAEAAQGEIIHQMEEVVGQHGAEAINALLAAAHNPESGTIASIVAGIFLVLGATSAFVELKESLDELWNIPKPQQATVFVVLKSRFLSFSLVLVLAFLLLVSLVISAILALLENYLNEIWHGSVIIFSILTALIPFAIIAGLFAVIYKMLPDAPLSWQDVWLGAIFTAVLFSLGKYLIGVYLSRSGVTSSFGAAGSVIALLLWVYYSAQIFFFGAEFTRQYALHCGSLRHKPNSA